VRYGSGSDQMMQLLAAPATQHCFESYVLKCHFMTFKVIFLEEKGRIRNRIRNSLKSWIRIRAPKKSFGSTTLMNILFRAYFRKIKFTEETWPKIYKGQDPDPDFSKVGSGSGQKSPGTLVSINTSLLCISL
jgi:hypothetical protein